MTIGGTEGKTILAMNNKKKPLDDLKVRQAIAYAIDRKAIIDGAMNGLGAPIGSHLTPNDQGYVDLTGMYPHDPEKAKALLKEAGADARKVQFATMGVNLLEALRQSVGQAKPEPKPMVRSNGQAPRNGLKKVVRSV